MNIKKYILYNNYSSVYDCYSYSYKSVYYHHLYHTTKVLSIIEQRRDDTKKDS